MDRQPDFGCSWHIEHLHRTRVLFGIAIIEWYLV